MPPEEDSPHGEDVLHTDIMTTGERGLEDQALDQSGGKNASMTAAAINRLHQDRESRKAGRDTIIERSSPQDTRFSVVKKGPKSKEIERKEFTIEVLDGPDHPTFPPTYALMQDRFGAEELDPEDIMKDQMRGLRKGYESMGTRAQIISIKNEKNEVVCTLNGGVLPLLDETGKETGEAIFMVFYVATRPDVEGIGIGREIMITAYQAAEEEARARNLKLIGAAGECTYTSQRYWENLGWRRAYTEDSEGTIAEVPYVQPPLDFDLKTGEVAEGCGDAPEHFMVRLFQEEKDNPALGQKLLSMVKAFYRANNDIDRRAFEQEHPEDSTGAEQAYQTHRAAITPHLEQFQRDVMRGKISFLSGPECKALETMGRKVRHYLTPDEQEEAAAAATTENL